MFDIGFWELAVVGVIGLIVLGPERLPVVARTLGRWVRRARYYVNALTTELENEVGAEDIRNDVRRAREQIESETRAFRSSAERSVEPLMEPIEDESEARERYTATETETETEARTSASVETEPKPGSHAAGSSSNTASRADNENRS